MLQKNSIFFALKGNNFNGNSFAEQALKAGCSYVVIDEEQYKKGEQYILVDDVLASLQKLAHYHRQQINIPVIAITGTNGKTTTKELVAAVLKKKYNILATTGNLNNHIGVPLTLLSITKQHQLAIIEMGANHIEEINALCLIAAPNYGLITNIGKAHLEGFGSAEGVIKAKYELYNYIKQNKGTLFVNADNSLLIKLSEGINKILYGTSSQNDCIAEFIAAKPFTQLKWKIISDNQLLTTKPILNTHLVGKYNFENIVSAACIGSYFKVDYEQIGEAIQSYKPSNNRSQIIKKGSNTILLDAYNANPTSMAAALESFSEMNVLNKILILGDMLELGENSKVEHELIMTQIKDNTFLKIILIGTWFSAIENKVNATTFQNTEAAMYELKNNVIQNTTILIKGSRGLKLEQLITAIQ